MRFKEIQFFGAHIHDYKLVHSCDSDKYRLYWSPFERGFAAIALEFESCSSRCENQWDDPDLSVGIIFRATAYHDGIRHFYVKNEDGWNRGYLYRPNISSLIELLQKLKILEELACNPHEPGKES